jgi:hypothetical protein
MSRTRRRQRRPRLMPELAPGEALPRGEQYKLWSGQWTRDRELAQGERKLEREGVHPADALFPGHRDHPERIPPVMRGARSVTVFPHMPGCVPMMMLDIEGQQVPVYMHPELDEPYDATFDVPSGWISA